MAPESFYNSMLDDVCNELESKGLGGHERRCPVRVPPGFTGRDGNPVPLMLRRATAGTAMTAPMPLRSVPAHQLGAARIIYGRLRQKQHLKMIFELARQAGWLVPLTMPTR
jgi:arginyl-tRNA synthetase